MNQSINQLKNNLLNHFMDDDVDLNQSFDYLLVETLHHYVKSNSLSEKESRSNLTTGWRWSVCACVGLSFQQQSTQWSLLIQGLLVSQCRIVLLSSHFAPDEPLVKSLAEAVKQYFLKQMHLSCAARPLLSLPLSLLLPRQSVMDSLQIAALEDPTWLSHQLQSSCM